MRLSHAQKRFLKKNYRKLSVQNLALNINVSEKEVLEYLKDKVQLEKLEEKHTPSTLNIMSIFRQDWYYFIFFAILIFSIYYNSLHNVFLSDDLAAMPQNPNLGHFNKMFPSIFGVMQGIWHYIAFKLGGLNPAAYRIFNIGFHITAISTAFLIISLLINRKIALIIATIYAVHPLISEPVVWISGGHYVMYSMFALLSFLFYILSRGKNAFYVLSIVCYIIALESNEKSVTFPIILFMYEFSFFSLGKAWKKLVPFFILMTVFALLYVSGSFGGTGYIGRVTSLNKDYYEKTGVDNPFTQVPVAISSYLQLFFWPDGLSLYHSELAFTPATFAIRAFEFAVFMGIVIWSFYKNRMIFFWLSFFFASLLPTLMPLKVSWIYAERYVYLGTLGLISACILPFNNIIENKSYKWIFYTVLFFIISALAIRTIIRNVDWANEDNLWMATARTSPSSPTNHNNLGDMYYRHGNYEKAMQEFQTAIILNPAYADAYHNMGNVYYKIGKINEALSSYVKAIELNSNLWQSYQNIAIISFELKNLARAEQYMLKASQLAPNNPMILNNLGIIYINTGKKPQARSAFETALKLNPKDEVASKYIKLTQ